MATVQSNAGYVDAPKRAIPRMPVKPARKVSIGTLLPLVILAYSFLILPIEVKLNFAGFNIYSYRGVIIILLIPAIVRAIKDLKSFKIFDVLILASCIWTIIAFTYRNGFEGGFLRSFAIFLDTFGAYLIARTSVRSLSDLRAFLILIMPGVLFAGVFLLIESLTGRLILRPLFASVFGGAVNYEGGVAQGALQLLSERRLGLLRAYSTFSYPILGGTILASLIPIYFLSGIRSWPFILGLAGSCFAFFTVSSAAIIALGLGFGLIMFDRLLPRLRPLNWHYVIGAGTAYAVLINFILESGIVGVIGRFTLNPATAYIRRLQWEYGTQSISNNPIFGIGFDEYERAEWMTAAIDAHFLSIGIRDGLATPLLLFAAVILIMVAIGKRAISEKKQERDLLLAVNFSIGILVFISMTVTYFSEANIWFMMVLGIGGAFAAGLEPAGAQRLVRVRVPADFQGRQAAGQAAASLTRRPQPSRTR